MNRLILVIFIFSLTSCFNDDSEPTYNIPEDYRFIYGESDLLIYISNTGLYDTFGISRFSNTERFCNTDFESYVWSEKCWNEVRNSVHIYPYKTRETSWLDSLFTMHLRMEKMSEPKFSYSINSLEYRFGTGHNGKSIYDSVAMIRINDWNYYAEVFLRRDTTATNIRKIWCTSNYGVLRYEMANGEVWELQIDR